MRRKKDKLIEALKASESNLWHSSREFEEENRKLNEELKMSKERINKTLDRKLRIEKEKSELQETINKQDHTIATLFDERENLKQELHNIYKENEYLLNVIKMSENIEIHLDAYDEMEKGENNKTHHIPHLTDIKINKNIEEPMRFIKRIAKERADDER